MARRDWLLILLLFAVTRAGVVAAGTWANTALEQNEGEQFTHLLDGGPALDMWYRWDAGFYATIATDGYKWFNERRPDADMAFLPLYPLTVGAIMRASGCGYTPYLSTCATVSGLIVSNIALLAATFLLYDLARRRFDRLVGLGAAALLLVSPGAIFFSGVYTESLFLLWAILTFWLLERGQFGWAVGVACLAVLTRSVGLALVPALVWQALTLNPSPSGRGTSRSGGLPPAFSGKGASRNLALFPFALREKGLGDEGWKHFLLACLPALVFIGYVLFAGLHVGEPLAYLSANEALWGRDITRPPWETLLAYFSGGEVSLWGAPLSWFDLVVFLVCLVASVLILRYDRAWGLFALFAMLIPFASGTLTGMPRFVSVIFPFYIVLAAWLRPRWQLALAGAASSALALFVLVRFVTWRWIA
ncbi:MAG: mannosyltransferase family protein [Chloroflexota bacterium]|nr:mannosyltransferase family protein [Chloroflexota bacterium]